MAEVILTCAQQGIALRGHGDSMDDLASNPGNFKMLLHTLSRHDSVVQRHLMEGPRNASYLGHATQNEILEIMAGLVRQKIQSEVCNARFYTLIVDESKDISKKEQMAVVLRYVHSGVIHERFIEYVHASKLDAASLTSYILHVLSELQLDIQLCVSQCYDEWGDEWGIFRSECQNQGIEQQSCLYSLLCASFKFSTR